VPGRYRTFIRLDHASQSTPLYIPQLYAIPLGSDLSPNTLVLLMMLVFLKLAFPHMCAVPFAGCCASEWGEARSSADEEREQTGARLLCVHAMVRGGVSNL